MNMQTIEAGSRSLFPKNLNGSGFKYVCISPRVGEKTITKEQLLHRAWVVTGNSMRAAARSYSGHGELYKPVHTPKATTY